MRFFTSRLNTPFARRWGALIGFVTLLLFVSNPELLSVALLVNTLGVDIVVLLLGIQLRHQWSAINVFVITPFCLRMRRLFKP